MTKKYTIIILNGFMYAVDTITPTDTQYYIRDGKICPPEKGHGLCYCKPIIASNDPSLNLPLLPAVEVDVDVPELAASISIKHKEQGEQWMMGCVYGVIHGYKAASSKQYTEADMRKAFGAGGNAGASYNQLINDEDWDAVRDRENNSDAIFDKFIQSLKLTPVAVEIELWDAYEDVLEGNEFVARKAGKYLPVDKNNYVKVKQWIWEN